MNLSPQKADTTVIETEDGGYYAWTATATPVIATAKLGAGKLILKPRGFALPHFADTYKIGFCTQGKCTVGLVSPNSPKEVVVVIKPGDAIPVERGSISWWFNAGRDGSDTTVVFLGESSQSYTAGMFDYFFLTGALGVLRGFSADFVEKIYGLSQSDADKLVNSQSNPLLITVPEDVRILPNSDTDNGCVVNLGEKIEITGENFPLLDKFGLSASLVRAKAGVVVPPSYSADATYRMIYVVRGGGRVQISGLNGVQALDAEVQEDQMFVVPQFFAVAAVAGEKGMELFSVSTSARPVWGQLSGKTSAWKAISAPVLQVALNVSPEFVKVFKLKIDDGDDEKGGGATS